MLSVTIITPSYNDAATLLHTVQSVAGQTMPPLEHLIMDGASTDGSITLLQSTTVTLYSGPDKGMYDAMNKGIVLAKGDIIGILNADDFYASNRVLEQVVELFMTTGCDAVYGDLKYVLATNIQTIQRNWVAGAYTPGAFLKGWMPPHPTFFVKKSVYEQYGVFNLDLGTAADYELMLRLIHKHQITLGYLPQTLVHMRTGGASNQTLLARFKANRNDALAWKINGLRPGWYTLYAKPLRKLGQFLG
ncbi:MAG: glycosyltransferase [Microcystis viridis Mv_BB_P_19951000_S69D]|nr:MAG: glycosyltransferase [Microcystis viridis Mv_BB_P_19951000_S69D]